ncbi:hypothetical protein [Spirosoma oryzicola]|uniref:hypothetical protein n=1 Tax=Spirosoma oryzicola TaxID=2898794 RepID=UPI001E456236|nr:hypothetical protein [Spirosoma oryzicola]UHG93369.1 hypothetical protein LQ777_10800 [Spirosoma oryzicola]
MKSIKVLLGLSLLFIAALVTDQTGNVLAGVATIPALTYGFQLVTGQSLFSGSGLAFGALTAVKKPEQGVANPGGGRRLFLAPVDGISGEWPKKADIIEGELTVAPTMTAAVVGPPAIPAGAFIEVSVSDNSLKTDGALKGPTGYQSWEQSLEVKIAGFTKAQCAAIDKLLNQEVVAVVTMTDGQRAVLGSNFLGLQFEITHTSGAKGSDRREWTLKAKQDGYMFNYPILAASVTIPGVA